MARTSAKGLATQAVKDDARARKAAGQPSITAPTADSFNNFQHKLGVGADNALSSATYGFNPITRRQYLLEWIHRGSWLGGVAVDTVADDMTRAGIEYVSEMPPELSERIDRHATALNTWPSINEVIRWGRLYGGAVGIVMIDGQDMRTPLRVKTVAPGQYKGLMVLDRWMLEPSLEDLVTEFGPHIGLPRFYRVSSAAPALRNIAVHHSRVAIRHVGIDLPYQQRLTEGMWGISVLERLYDRMIAFDSASTGAAQLVYKAYLRTLSVDGLREIVAAGGTQLDGLTSYVSMMTRFQSIEGMTLIDAKDSFEIQGHQAFSGLGDILEQFGKQLAGALQIPLVRLFGQSPGGLNSSGDSDFRFYYDHIKQEQMKTLHSGVTTVYKLIAATEGVQLPPNFTVGFKSLWEMSDADKGAIASSVGDTVGKAVDSGLIGRQTALKELRQQSRASGVFTNITHEMIDAADDEVQPPEAEGAMPLGPDGQPMPLPPGMPTPGVDDGKTGPIGQESGVDQGASRRGPLQLTPPRRRPPGGSPGPRPGT